MAGIFSHNPSTQNMIPFYNPK